MAKQTPEYAGRAITRLLFLVYAGLMIWLLFVQRIDSGGTVAENWNFIPLKTLKLYRNLLSSADAYLVQHAIVNLVGNVVMFVPLGYFLPAVWKKLQSFWRCIACALLLIVLVELLQYVSGLGSCDVDDLLLNLPGVIIGYWVYRLGFRNRP